MLHLPSREGVDDETATSLTSVELALRQNSAACALREGRHDDALSHCDAALAISPSATKAHYRRAQALAGLNRLPEAEAALDATLRLEPANKAANQLLTDVRARRGA